MKCGCPSSLLASWMGRFAVRRALSALPHHDVPSSWKHALFVPRMVTRLVWQLWRECYPIKCRSCSLMLTIFSMKYANASETWGSLFVDLSSLRSQGKIFTPLNLCKWGCSHSLSSSLPLFYISFSLQITGLLQ